MTKTYELSDFLMTKAFVRRKMNIEFPNGVEEDFPHLVNCDELLRRKTTKYTLKELEDLAFYVLLNQECDIANDSHYEEVSPREVLRCKNAEKKSNQIYDLINKYKEREKNENGLVHVKINKHYTATVRNVESFKDYLNQAKVVSEVDLSLIAIVFIDSETRQEFTNKIQFVIDKYYSANLNESEAILQQLRKKQAI